jgi:ribosome-associated protein
MFIWVKWEEWRKGKIMPDTENAARKSDGKKEQSLIKSMSSKERAIILAREASRYMALELVLLDVAKHSSFADYFIICSGKSSRQVQGIADNVESSIRDKGLRPLGIEGKNEGHWILMDYGDIILHIFYEPVRYHYDLESLWADASRLAWEDGPVEDTSEQESR